MVNDDFAELFLVEAFDFAGFDSEALLFVLREVVESFDFPPRATGFDFWLCFFELGMWHCKSQ